MAEGDGPFPADSPVSLEDLDRLYPLAAAQGEGRRRLPRPRPQGDRRAAGRPRRLPRPVGAISSTSPASALEREFHALGVDFDLWKGESDADA